MKCSVPRSGYMPVGQIMRLFPLKEKQSPPNTKISTTAMSAISVLWHLSRIRADNQAHADQDEASA